MVSAEYSGNAIGETTDYVFIVERTANTDYDVVEIPVGKDHSLPPKVCYKNVFHSFGTSCTYVLRC